jgi:hypothetical protein
VFIYELIYNTSISKNDESHQLTILGGDE